MFWKLFAHFLMPKLLNHSINKQLNGFLILEKVAWSGSCASTLSILSGSAVLVVLLSCQVSICVTSSSSVADPGTAFLH